MDDGGANPRTADSPVPIAVVGASAGGLEALRALFSAMPAETGIAFLVVQHRQTGHESLLVDLIARDTHLPVEEGVEGLPLCLDRVVLAPAGCLPRIEGGRLRVSPVPAGPGISLPIDHALTSLARDRGHTGIAIILSGAGGDGTIGARAVREAGGLVVAQAPETAGMASMPETAIDSGAVDLVLAPADMPAALVDFAQHPYLREPGDGAASALERLDALDEIVALLLVRTGISFRDYKRRTLARRIERRMGILRVKGFPAYLEYLRAHPEEADALRQDLLISVTRFFRDREAFEILRDTVIVPLVRARHAGDAIRVWVPGCATGEEAYSLAMLFLDAGAGRPGAPDIKIFATDIDDHALGKARAGSYPETVEPDLPPGFRDRFFIEDEGRLRVAAQVRNAVVFAHQDLLHDPPFSQLDLISCRNLLIYTEPAAQKRLVPLLHFALNEGGSLFLGSAESTAGNPDLFEPISARHKIFRRLGARRIRHLNLPGAAATATGEPAAKARPDAGRGAADLMRQALFAEFVPPAVLVDRRGQIRFVHGPLADILDFPTGEPRIELLAMTSGELRVKLREALRQAAEIGGRVEVAGVRAGRDGNFRSLRLVVLPVTAGQRLGEQHYVVVFVPDRTAVPAPPVPADQEPIVARLERELLITRADLEGTIRELEEANESLMTANEEVTTINEELQSTNEELETSKEELQSLNEELSTVNVQLQDKIEELEAIGNDLTNLLNSTAIPTVFLDTQRRIRRFTPAAVRLFTLIAGDVGRPITDISRRFEDLDLLADIDRVLQALVPAEAEVAGPHGSTLLRRVLPYRTQQNRIEGVVVTFTDITVQVEASALSVAHGRQQGIVADLGQRALTGIDAQTLLRETVTVVAAALDTDCVAVFEIAADASLRVAAAAGPLAASLANATIPADPLGDLGQAATTRLTVRVADFATEPAIRPPAPLAKAEVRSGIAVPFAGPPPRLLAVHDRQPGAIGDQHQRFLQSVANLLGLALERLRAEGETRSARDLAQDIIDTQRLPSLLLDASGRIVSANAAYYKAFDSDPDDLRGRRPADIAPGLWDVPALHDAIATVGRGGGPVVGLELQRPSDAAQARSFQLDVQPLGRTPGMMVITVDDVTEDRQAARELSQAKRAAELASAAKSRFLAAASHDLRQPLQGAVLFHALAVQRNEDPDVAQLLGTLGDTLQVLQDMLETLLDISRLDAGIVRADLEPVDLDRMLGRLVAEYGPQATAVGLRLRWVPSGLWGIADPKLLDRVLRNLIGNALRYTRQGGILIGCRRTGARVTLQVWDTGQGIPPEEREAIFDEFHQIDNAARDRHQGLGLGLAIVRRLARLMGHEVGVRSVVGRGSVFEVVLPRSAPATAAANGDTANSHPLLLERPRAAVVVEDDPIVLKAVDAALASAHWQMIGGATVPAILERLPEASPDAVACIISDYRLSGGASGIEAIEQVRSALGRSIPGILLTGDTSPERLREAEASGLRLLHKPVTLPDLLAALAAAC